MKKLLVTMSMFLYLAMGSLPMFWPIPSFAATASTNSTTQQDSASMLNNYLQQQQQAAAAQKQQAAQQQQQAATTNQNTKLIWPWWVKVFSGAMVINAVLAFFALSFSLVALWKWLAFKRES